jgi:acetyl-CoA carboxylase biotin carboxyl carrier protein
MCELELRAGGSTLLLVRSAQQPVETLSVATEQAAITCERSSSVELVSPAVGTFIAEHPATAQRFSEVGGEVKIGDIMGLVCYGNFLRAVEAVSAGRISAAFVESGEKVGFGQKLFELETRSET